MLITCVMLILCLQKMLQNNLTKKYDDMYCVTIFTGTTGTKFYTQYRRTNLTKEFGNAVEEYHRESKKKRTVAASGNLQDYMNAVKNQLSK